MKDYTLQHKIARVIAELAVRLNVSQSQALLIFYESKVCMQLHNPETGLQLMSDKYVVDEFMMQRT
ncbi:MAG: DUF3791 domain-containing protein [Fibrobacter sp.]|nr:DUF3791 domain-containing protein [Fibrobacter sp.]